MKFNHSILLQNALFRNGAVLKKETEKNYYWKYYCEHDVTVKNTVM